ncbi:hypothetical protein BH10BAC1_BH10BAC1_12050 [soil metagenome]
MLFVPLNIRGTTLGVLSVQKKQVNGFDSEDKQILELLSHFVALAISNLRWKQGFENLIRTGQELTQLDVIDSMQGVVDLIRKHTKANIVALHPYDHRFERFMFPIIYSGKFIDKQPPPNIALDDDTATLGLRFGKPIFCESRKLYKNLGGDTEKRGGNFEMREKIESVAMLPLRLGGKPVGILFLNFSQKQLFTPSQKNLIEGLAIFVAIAITNSSAFQDTKQRTINNLEALGKIDCKIIETNDRKDIFDTILLVIKENLQDIRQGGTHGTILIYNKEKNALIVENHLGENAHIRLERSISLADKKGLTYHAWRDKKTIRVGNVRNDSRYLRIDENTVSEMDTPIIDQGKAIGVISFESKREDFFTENDEEFLKAVANQVVVAKKKVEAFERETAAREHELAIGIVAKKIIEDQLNFEQVAESILDKSLELTNYEAGAILLYDKDRKDFFIGAGRNIESEMQSARLPEDDGLTGLVFKDKDREPLIANVTESPYKEIFKPWIKGVKWALVVPIHKGKQKPFIGVIAIEGKRKFTEQDQELLEELADLAVIAFENAKNYEKVIDAVETLEILNQIGRKLGEIIDIESLETTYQIIGKTLNKKYTSQVVIRKYEIDKTDKEGFRKVWQAKNQQPEPHELIDINKSSYIYQKFQNRETIIVYNMGNDEVMKKEVSDPRIKSLVIVWVTFQNEIYGSISLSHSQNDHFQDIDRNLIEGLAQLLGLTIYRLKAEEDRRDSEVFGFVGRITGNLAHDIIGDIGAIPNEYEILINEIKNNQINTGSLVHNIIGDIGSIPYEYEALINEIKNNQINEVEKDKFIEDVIVDIQKIKQRCSEIMENFEYKKQNKELIDAKVLFNEIKSVKLVKNPKVKIKWNADRNLAKVKVIKSQIFNIIENLIKNAAYEIREGGEISISIIRHHNFIKISVSDTGKGIDSNDLEKIFRLGVSTRGSSGVGLPFSKYFAERHNGTLVAANNKNGGAIFTLALPISS